MIVTAQNASFISSFCSELLNASHIGVSDVAHDQLDMASQYSSHDIYIYMIYDI